MPIRFMPAGRLALLALLVLVPLGAAVAGEDQVQTERWYEQLINGQKAGHYQVVWAPSTWEGRKTVHDTTTVLTSTVRNMIGTMDRFTTTTRIDLERGEDGTLWTQRYEVEEAGRVQFEQLTWTGEGYDHAQGIVGEKEIKKHIPLTEPVMLDSESFLGHLHRLGKLEVGQKHDLRQINVRAERAETTKLEVIAIEPIEDENGDKIECLRILEVNPRTKAESTMWLDAQGAFVRIQTGGGTLLRRVTKDKAIEMPVKPAEMRITTPATPNLERVFGADRHLVDLHIQADPNRKLPDFPESPWSRELGREGSDQDGWVYKLELTSYDCEDLTATVPIADEAFEDDLEPTVLMQSDHPKLKEIVKSVVGDETDARKAAYKLVRYVFTSLSKQSPDVGQASALQIIEMQCGDCSEHCLLFVALCRAAGIPARRCSGYVNIGSDWGAHAWAEIWTGQWIAADPTTGELGGGARYLFFGYSDRADSYPGVVSTRARGRMRYVSTRIEEGEAGYDLTDSSKWRLYDEERGRYLHVLCGLEAHKVPEGWKVNFSGNRNMVVKGDELLASLHASADQGYDFAFYRSRNLGSAVIETTFGGAPALLFRQGATRTYTIFSRRRRVALQVMRGATPENLALLERALAPTFAESPPAWDEDADGEDGE